MEKFELNKKITLTDLKNKAKDDFKWSTNKYCQDKEKAANDEEFFEANAIEFNPEIEVIRPTSNGFYATLTFNTTKSKNNTVVLRIPTSWCILNYQPSLNYFGQINSVESVLPYLKVDHEEIPETYYDLIFNCEQIEKFIPQPDGSFISGGPARVAMFYYNTCLEAYIVLSSLEGKLKDLGIDKFKPLDKTHFVFKQGAGNYLPDLETSDGIKYEVKGPFAKADNFLVDTNKNKDAKYILHFNGSELCLYKKLINGSYTNEPVKIMPFDFEYPNINKEFSSSWNEYNSTIVD